MTLSVALALISQYGSEQLAQTVSGLFKQSNPDQIHCGDININGPAIAQLDHTIVKAIDLMRENIEHPLPIRDVSSRVGVPPWYLRRLFLRHFQIPPQTYLRHLRLEHARHLLRSSQGSIKTIAHKCGYSEGASLSRAYREHYGVSPSRDRLP